MEKKQPLAIQLANSSGNAVRPVSCQAATNRLTLPCKASDLLDQLESSAPRAKGIRCSGHASVRHGGETQHLYPMYFACFCICRHSSKENISQMSSGNGHLTLCLKPHRPASQKRKTCPKQESITPRLGFWFNSTRNCGQSSHRKHEIHQSPVRDFIMAPGTASCH